MIQHHPRRSTLQDYATGVLPPALFTIVEVHLGYCKACCDGVAAFEAIETERLTAAEPAPVSEASWEYMLRRLDEPPPPPPPILNAHLPPPLDRLRFGRWWPLTPRIGWRSFQMGGIAWGGLLLMRPGGALPPHGHTGRELTCVLSGAFSDGEAVYYPGDLADPTHHHDTRLSVVGAQPCLCVVGSEGMRLRGIAGLVQGGIDMLVR